MVICHLLSQLLKHGSAGVWDTEGSFGSLQHFLQVSVNHYGATELVNDFGRLQFASVAGASDLCDQVSHFGAQKKFREGIQDPKIDKKYEKIYFLVVTIVHIAYRSMAAIKAELKTEKKIHLIM